MNYSENDDELQRLRSRRQGRGAGSRHIYEEDQDYERRGTVQRTSKRAYQPLDDTYFEEEYGYTENRNYSYEKDEIDVPFARTSAPRTRSGSQTNTRRPSGSRRSSDTGRMSSRSAGAKTGVRSPRPVSRQTSVNQENRNRRRSSSGNSRAVSRTRKRKWPAILLVFLAAICVYGGWLFIHKPTGYWNIAVFGVDSRDGDTKKALADVQMICSINRETGEIRLVSVYRDTYLKIDEKGTYHKINEAYFKGGQKQAVNALEENLDLKIDDYATFNWKAVADAINVLDGIDLEITPAEFKYINGFITETVNSTGIGSVQLTQPGMNHLDGVQAVAYSRLRLMDTDFQRTERQRKVVSLAMEKAKAADAATLTGLVKVILPQISTSVGIDDVLPMVKDINKYHIGETGGFPFSRESKKVGKMSCVIPTTLESNVVLLHQFLYGEDVSYSPSAAVKKISAKISEETGLYEEGKAAPSGSSSGKTSSGSAKPQPEQTAPAATQPEETTIEETTVEETTEEETMESTIDALDEEEIEETEEEIGPGISHEDPYKKTEASKDASDSKNEQKEEKGPGVSESQKPEKSPEKEPSKEAPEKTEASDDRVQGPGATDMTSELVGPGV